MPQELLPYIVPAGATGGSSLLLWYCWRVVKSLDRLTRELHAMNTNIAVALSRIDGHEKRLDKQDEEIRSLDRSLHRAPVS